MARYGLSKEQIRGYASEIQNNRLLQGVMDETQEGAIETWIANPPGADASETAWHAYHTVDAIRNLISNSVAEAEEKDDTDE